MRGPRISEVLALTLCVALAGGSAAQVQTKPTSVDDSANVETELEEIVIRGERGSPWGELRVEIERAQEAIYARFNEINSTDEEKYFLDMGVRHFCIGTDINILYD